MKLTNLFSSRPSIRRHNTAATQGERKNASKTKAKPVLPE
jgi:hypothetical protein